MNDYRRIKKTNYYVTSNAFVFKKISDYEFQPVNAYRNEQTGYFHVSIMDSETGIQNNRLLHRLVAEAFLKKPYYSKKLEINHINGIKSDNRVENLEWVTRRQNMKLAWQAGQFANVSKAVAKKRKEVGITELTPTDVRQIRSLKAEKLTNKEIGFIFNLCAMQVSRICNFRSWANVV